MNRLTKTLFQLVTDLENQLDSALKSCNMLNRLNQQLDECNQKNEDLMVRLQAAQRELERPQQDLQQYLDQIDNLNKGNKQQRLEIQRLNDKIDTLKNTPPARGPWDNRTVMLPGYGTVLAIQLYEQGWPEAVINCLPCPAPTLVPSYSEWYRTYGQTNGWIPPQPPGSPSVALSDDQSHWVAIPDDEPPEAPEPLQSFRQRNRAKPEHSE